MKLNILQGDCRETLATLPAASVHCCVTSPPYFGLRDYKVDGQIGLEQTPDDYVAEMVAVFREVRRVLRDDGTVWLNLGDSYARQAGDDSTKLTDGGMKTGRTGKSDKLFKKGNNTPPSGLKPKDLIGIPWRVAFALQADGWYLRQDIIWAKAVSGMIRKGSAMPESVRDRFCKSHEYLFLLTKSARYWFDSVAVADTLDNAESHEYNGAHENENLLQVQRAETDDLFQQEQSTGRRIDRGVQGVPIGDSEEVESEIQSNGESEGDGDALLLFREGAGGEARISRSLRDDAGATRTVSGSGATAREGTKIQSDTDALPQQREGEGDKGQAGSQVGENGQGAICQAQDGDQAQASDQDGSLHSDADGVGGDQGAVRASVRVLQPDDGASGNGSCEAAVEGRGAHGGEYCSGVPDVQRPKGRGGRNAFRGQGHFRDGENGPANRDGRDMKDVGCGATATRRSVWLVSPQPFSGAHFATFPPKLIEPCILAGCPEKCCPKCGKGWERVTETSGGTWEARKAAGAPIRDGLETCKGTPSNRKGESSTRTIGHRPACDCGETGHVPGVTIDPFGGAGTTALVALQQGRDAILCELNAEYIELARKRLAPVLAQGRLSL